MQFFIDSLIDFCVKKGGLHRFLASTQVLYYLSLNKVSKQSRNKGMHLTQASFSQGLFKIMEVNVVTSLIGVWTALSLAVWPLPSCFCEARGWSCGGMRGGSD